MALPAVLLQTREKVSMPGVARCRVAAKRKAARSLGEGKLWVIGHVFHITDTLFPPINIQVPEPARHLGESVHCILSCKGDMINSC